MEIKLSTAFNIGDKVFPVVHVGDKVLPVVYVGEKNIEPATIPKISIEISELKGGIEYEVEYLARGGFYKAEELISEKTYNEIQNIIKQNIKHDVVEIAMQF